MNYQPKGSQCAACTKKADDCSKLPFNKMRKHEAGFFNLSKNGEATVIVICSEFKKQKPD